MTSKRQDFVKRLFSALVVVMMAFSFHVTLKSSPKKSLPREPKSTKQGSRGYKATTETSQGLYTATLNTPRGKINVNLPADMAAGDTISGTVYQEAVGKTEEERTKNLGELNGIVLEVKEIKDKQTPATQKRDSWIIPTAINAMHLVFKNKDGIEIGRTKVPVYPEPQVSPPVVFQLPEIGQAGNFLRVHGPFDGDFKSTGVRIGDFDAEPLAESPRGLIVLTPYKVTGQTKITLKERDIEKSGNYRSVSVHLSADKLQLKSGETTPLTITVTGLDRLEDEVPFRLQNKSPGTISMEGGTIRTHIIRAGDIGPGGIYTMNRTLTGKVPGTFGISARICPQLKQCAERLGGNTGMEYRKELTDLQKEEILTMPESHFITFTKKDLYTYKTSTEPSVPPGMKECASELLDFLNTAKPADQQWLANIYMKRLFKYLKTNLDESEEEEESEEDDESEQEEDEQPPFNITRTNISKWVLERIFSEIFNSLGIQFETISFLESHYFFRLRLRGASLSMRIQGTIEITLNQEDCPSEEEIASIRANTVTAFRYLAADIFGFNPDSTRNRTGITVSCRIDNSTGKPIISINIDCHWSRSLGRGN